MAQVEQTKLRIYLAGKISKNGWRNDIVKAKEPSAEGLGHPSNLVKWPILERAIFGIHDYVGPFFVRDDHGSLHGRSSHGVGAYIEPEKPPFSVGFNEELGIHRTRVAQLCKTAINKATFIFAWLDAPDAFGTFFELGFAMSKGKPVYIASQANFKHRKDMWFFETLADKWITGSSPRECLQTGIQLHYEAVARDKSITEAIIQPTTPTDPISRKWNYSRASFETGSWSAAPASEKQIWYIQKLAKEKPDIGADMLHLVQLYFGEAADFGVCTKGAATFIISAFTGEIRPKLLD